MDKALLHRIASKHHLDTKHDFCDLYDALAVVDIQAAKAFRDAVWHKDGKWHGIGIGRIAPKEIIEYVLELERMVKVGEKLPLCHYSIEEGERHGTITARDAANAKRQD